MNKKIIVFTGKMGVGKTTSTNIATEYINFLDKKTKIIKFAEPLYKLQKVIYNSVGLEEPSTKDRKLLQFLGTDWGRSISENIWVNLWEREVLRTSNNTFIICDDCRFDNEAIAARKLGAYVIRITGESRCEQINSNHESEKGVSDKYIDFEIVNKTNDLNVLRSIVRRLLGGVFFDRIEE